MKEYEGGDIQHYASLSWLYMDTSLGFKALAPLLGRGMSPLIPVDRRKNGQQNRSGQI
jgi:hypothetical protein